MNSLLLVSNELPPTTYHLQPKIMCLTIPVKIKKVNGAEAELEDGRKVNIALIKDSKKGDWILTNANLGLSKISAKEAKEINNYFKQL